MQTRKIIIIALVPLAGLTWMLIQQDRAGTESEKRFSDLGESYAKSLAERDIADEAFARDIDKALSGQPILMSCTVCKGNVSSDATKCPHCGDPR